MTKKYLLIFLTLTPTALLCVQCAGVQNFFRSLQSSKVDKESALLHPYQLSEVEKKWHSEHHEMLAFLSGKKNIGIWRLSTIRYHSGDSVNLQVVFSSESRYNSKFDPPEKRKVEEWNKNNKKFLEIWDPPIQQIHSEKMDLILKVTYRHKNYLRSSERFQIDTLIWRFPPEDLKN